MRANECFFVLLSFPEARPKIPLPLITAHAPIDESVFSPPSSADQRTTRHTLNRHANHQQRGHIHTIRSSVRYRLASANRANDGLQERETAHFFRFVWGPYCRVCLQCIHPPFVCTVHRYCKLLRVGLTGWLGFVSALTLEVPLSCLSGYMCMHSTLLWVRGAGVWRQATAEGGESNIFGLARCGCCGSLGVGDRSAFDGNMARVLGLEGFLPMYHLFIRRSCFSHVRLLVGCLVGVYGTKNTV